MNKRLVEKLLLRPGACFFANIEEAFSSAKPHFFFVLNHNPESDKVIVLTNATTQKEIVFRRAKRLTGSYDCIVTVEAGEYSGFLPKDSHFDLSDLKAVDKEAFLNYSDEFMNAPQGISLPSDLFQKMIQKIIDCDAIAEEIKELVIPPKIP